MSGSTPGGAVRSLPARPSLEYERKRAKALLRRLRRDGTNASLSDAQLVVARELGFASWPRLVQYFGVLQRKPVLPADYPSHSLDFYDGSVRGLLAEHRLGRVWAGRALAAYVPRLYGRSIAEVLALSVTIEDARLVVARQHQCSSWDQLVAEVTTNRDRQGDAWTRENTPLWRGLRAMRAHDLDALAAIVGEHPQLLEPSDEDEQRGYTLVHNAVILELRERTAEARGVTDWLVSRGMSLAGSLNRALLGFHGMTRESVQYLLDRGADPNWVPPNGVSVLEHAILRYWNGDAVDLLASHVVPRRSLWIEAGLGNVTGVKRYFRRDGSLAPAARADRPPFDLMGSKAMPSLPDPDDRELLAEVVLVAAINGRIEVIELFIERGFPIDYTGWGGTSLLRLAIGQTSVGMVRALLRLGADLDTKGEWPHASAREFARMMVQHQAKNPDLRTILELCGAGTPEDVLEELDRRRPSPPPLAEKLHAALELAADDAARRGQTTVRLDNLFVGLMRLPELPLAFLAAAGVDVGRLRAAVGDRLRDVADSARSSLPLDTEAQAVVARAVAIADERRRDHVMTLQLLEALVEDESSSTARLIIASGGKLAELRATLARA